LSFSNFTFFDEKYADSLPRCLFFQACVFNFGTEFCKNDPWPGARKNLLVNVTCVRDDVISQDGKAVTSVDDDVIIDRRNKDVMEHPNADVAEQPNADVTEQPNADVAEQPNDDVEKQLNGDITEQPNGYVISSAVDDVKILSEIEVTKTKIMERRDIVLNIVFDSKLDEGIEDFTRTILTDRWVHESVVFSAGCPPEPYAAGYRKISLVISEYYHYFQVILEFFFYLSLPFYTELLKPEDVWHNIISE
jgi:hypothetical protein